MQYDRALQSLKKAPTLVRRVARRDVAMVAILAVASLGLIVPLPASGHGAPATVLLLLLVLALLVEALPLPLSNGTELTLTVLPAALLWYYFGAEAAVIGVGLSVVALRTLWRQPEATVAAGIAVVSVWIAHVVAGVLLGVLPGMEQAIAPYLGSAQQRLLAFCLTFAAASSLLQREIADSALWRERTLRFAAGPLAIILIEALQWWGLQALPLFLLFVGAALLLARSAVAIMSLHDRVTALARRNTDLNRELADRREINSAIIAHAGAGILTVDTMLRVQEANQALADLIGRRIEEMQGHPLDEILGSEHSAAVGEALNRALYQRRPVQIDSVLPATEGPRELTTTYNAVPTPEGDLAFGVGVVHDVTEERAEARLREDYFSLVVHDLRNPLTTISGNTSLLEKELDRVQGKTTTARTLVARIEKANNVLLRLVNALLELQRVESGRDLARPEPVELGPLIEEVAGEFAGAISDRGQSLRLHGPGLRAWANPTWCRAIITNLLSNAVKYTPPGGEITVTAQDRGGDVAVGVTDTGYGLAPEEITQLFTEFFRSKRPELHAARGTGLGLALAKRMAERMGGAITVESTVGVGSIFTVVLPCGDVPPFVEWSRKGAADEPARQDTGDHPTTEAVDERLAEEVAGHQSAEEVARPVAR